MLNRRCPCQLRHRLRKHLVVLITDLNDLIDAVRAENPDIQQFECSVFNGVYVTKDVDQGYLDFLDTLRNDDAKAVQRQNEVENLEMHNEG